MEDAMQFRTRVQDGQTTVDVIDASDGAVVRSESISEGEQFIVTANTAHSPSDLSYGEVESIPEPEAEAAEAGEQPDGEQAAAGDSESGVEQPSGAAEGAEAPADGQGTPAEGDGEQAA
jgi:hypothetical protein